MAGGAVPLFSMWLMCLLGSQAAPVPPSPGPGNSGGADELALLSIKSMLSAGASGGLLASWNTSGLYCAWPGVLCGRRHPERVVALHLREYNLSGRISPSLGNLSFLSKLDLGGNRLIGEIPPELGRLGKLRFLNLSANSLQGTIPAAIGGCTKLTKLDLSNNQLRGEIPLDIGTSLRDLEDLYLENNSLSGDIPPSLGGLPLIQTLSLANNKLSGEIPPAIGNLSFLMDLSLGSNRLVGEIPPELSRLSELQILDLSGNSLHGTIPAAIGGCTKLEVLSLGDNQLQGEIPFSIGANMRNLTDLVLESNALWGEIPPSLGNLTNLLNLSLAGNHLSGAIPSSLGQLSALSWLILETNNLTGEIPASVWNISSLMVLSVRENNLSGTIPPNAFDTLPNLQEIYMDNNQFHGHIPTSLANASNLWLVQLHTNPFNGIVPRDVGRLRNLRRLLLANTLLEANEPKDWEFLAALTNCSQLEEFELGGSKLAGVLPDSLSNLSTSLTSVNLASNTISGSIPKDIGNLVNLKHLVLAQNSFTGSLPSSLSRLKSLQHLELAGNKLVGSVLTVGNLTELIDLNLAMNGFSGSIPSTLGNLTNLVKLYLAKNNFTGMIPRELFHTSKHWLYLDISHNKLEGSIPQEIGSLKALVQLSAGWNRLSGEIPAILAECLHLQHLSVQNNLLEGSIPALGVSGLETLDLSSNNLSGDVPKFLGNLEMLYYLNLSFNRFVGEVPTTGVFSNFTAISIQGNNKLCGGISDLRLPPCLLQSPNRKHKFVVILLATSLVAILAILSLLYKLLTRDNKRKAKIPSTTSIQGHPLISYSQLAKATDGFLEANLLGSGSFGSVYKGELDGQSGESTNHVAVKVLKLQTRGALKSFIAECEALRNLRHRNLVKVITACSSIDTRGNDFKAIVYDFMPNGSLEGWLHPDTNDRAEQRHLNLRQRVTILLDVAYALDYLHCHGPAPIVHCDVKSSNVLLDADMTAHVGDFGLARILAEGSSIQQQSTSSMGFRGTIGYAAPEYGTGNTVSTHGDIYSYGILVLETVTGKRPSDSKFGQGLSLREYVEHGLSNTTVDVVDARLSLDIENELTANAFSYKRTTDSLVSLLTLGLSCSLELPSSRTPTGVIIKELHAIKESLEGIQNMMENM